MRLRCFDYATPGAYFVTVCTKGRERLFGAVCAGEMVVNDAGRICQAAWLDLPRHYTHVGLDSWIVMPDHVHGIIVLADGDLRDAVGAGFKPAPAPPTSLELTAGAGFNPAPTPPTSPELTAGTGFKPAPSTTVSPPTAADSPPSAAVSPPPIVG